MNYMVVLPLAILVTGVVAQAACARLLSGTGKGWLAFATSLAAAGAVIALWPTVHGGEALDLRLIGWDGPASLAYHVDGLGLLFALMGTGIGSAVLLYSIGYMKDDPSATRFYILMQIFIGGLVNLVLASDLLLMYASWELIGLCSFLLVGFWYRQREAAAGARKVLVMTHIAGYALLAAILVLYARTGTTIWTDPRVGQAFTSGVFALMLVASLAKSVQFPLHTWIPSAMAAPTPVSALLHAACYVKAGVYLVARMHSVVSWPAGWQTAVIWIGTATMLIGVLFAMVQHDAKRLLAFHTVSQIGYMMVGLGLGTPLGIVAALLHCLNHGLFKGGLFLGAGAVQHATGTRDMDKLGGLSRRMPRTTLLWLISAASIAGVPLFNGFVSKWLLYVAALDAGYPVPALIAWVVSVFTMFSFMKASSGMFFGEETRTASVAKESPRTMLMGSGVLAALCVVLGVAPQLAIVSVIEPAVRAVGLQPDVSVSWLGVVTTSGNWYATVGLLLAILGTAGGLLIYRLVRRPAVALAMPAPSDHRLLGARGPAATALSPLAAAPAATGSAPFTGGEALTPEGRLHAGDFSVALRQALQPFYAWADPDRYYLALWRGSLRLVSLCQRLSSHLERRALVVVPTIAVLIAIIGGLAATTRAGGIVQPANVRPFVVAVAVAAAALLIGAVPDHRLRSHAWMLGLIGVLATAGMSVPEPGRVLLLEAAAIGAFLLLVRSRVEQRARDLYLLAVVLSAATLVAGTLLIDHVATSFVTALLLAGFGVKLALVPAYLWLPGLAERTPALLVGGIVAVVDATAFAELAMLRSAEPWLFTPSWPWLALALLSAVGGAALALAQHDVKRLLAFSTITDSGFIVLAVAQADRFGLQGAVLCATAHALAKSLLFAGLAGAERDKRPVSLSSRGLAVRHPLAAAGFVAGALSALGVPPTVGFMGHWRVYETAYRAGSGFLVLLIVATALSVLAYARVIAVCWWGEPERVTEGRSGAHDEATRSSRGTHPSVWRSEPRPLAVVIVALAMLVLLAGVWPHLITGGW